ncbi:ATP-binding protein [Nonomuraea guangzhouensis]|uniref:ATP-binding protein n=1 Tax=Nonomuraea guangzhouensis TaxID=1291555 RepID=A0ABW4GY74_9ACTN|nr:ATP-binding protein [Nonomuraea guangzhouensis]
MTGNRVCWNRAAVDFATQVDVGGLEVDDPRADAVFNAIHQQLPVCREQGGRSVEESEEDVLRTFTRPITSNEPLLLFIKGEKGTGKSHLVRWLKTRLGARPSWHIVYIEKRNTSLRRVTEKILAGIDTPKARQLREELERASSEIASAEEAVSALLARLDHLVTFDPAAEIRGLSGMSAAELTDLRRKTHRLLGDYTFRNALSRSDGPVHRIVRLARGGAEPSEDIDEADLHLTEADLQVDPSVFDDLGPELQNLVGSLVSNRHLRADIATLCDWYLPRAKAEVFMGQGTDLLSVFEDVREEIATRGQELCLLIEDLVLLHGIDKQLAQALTIPASSRLCKLRAAIAVTSGYLNSLDTFTDRGVQFTLNINLKAIGQTSLRDFVGRYLNAGRLTDAALSDPGSRNQKPDIPNACLSCEDRLRCHATFGASTDDYGFYPFNGAAIDRLVELASPGDFQPREILREVIRGPLETAEEELPSGGIFPSGQFAKPLDDVRQSIPPGMRAAIRRTNHSNADAELSLRAFYAQSPPNADLALEAVAAYFGSQLSSGIAGDQDDLEERDDPPRKLQRQPASEIDQWANGVGLLTSGNANRVRRWICDAVIAHLQNGPYGVVTSRTKGSRPAWLIGSHTLRLTDVQIDRAQGGGAGESPIPFRIEATDDNALLIQGILAAVDGSSLDSVDQGRWFFYLQTRISAYASKLAHLATVDAATLPAAVQALEVLRYAAIDPGQTVSTALPAMLMPVSPAGQHPVVEKFLKEVRPVREEALATVRAHATAAKGAGKPSLFDVGPLLRHIQAHLKARSVQRETAAEDHDSQLLRQLQTRQSRAAEQAWNDVARSVQDVGRFLDPTEDLSATLKVVDRLVKECHPRGRLPRADSKEQYETIRNQVGTEAMESYRRLGIKIASKIGPGDLWDILNNPMPQLTALGRFAQVTNELLSSLEQNLTATQITGAVDTDALIRELRDLATLLDKASQEAQ